MTKTAAAILAERKHKTIQHMMSGEGSAIPVMRLGWENVIGIKYRRKDKKMVIELMNDEAIVEVAGPLLDL